MMKHTLKRKPMSDANVAQLATQKEGKVQTALTRGLSATSTKKGYGRTHISGWNKLDKAERFHPSGIIA